MPFLVEVYSKGNFVGDMLAHSIVDAKCRASKMCNKHFSTLDSFKVTGGEHHGIVFVRKNKVTKKNNKIVIKRGQWV